MKWKTIIKNNFIYILILVLILTASRYFSIGLATGDSMRPTIPSPSILLINKLEKDFQRNDIVVCRKDGWKAITKRIIGLPGETVTVTENGRVLINNALYEDNYVNITFPMYLTGDRTYPVILGENEYFVMGDNRNLSVDSRYSEIGNIRKEQIIGKVINY